MDAFQLKFLEEAADLIVDLEKALLALEQAPEDMKRVEEIFRVMHTLKGNSDMFGFEKIGEFTHDLETIYDLVRVGKQAVSRDLLNLTFACLDHLRTLLADYYLSDQVNQEVHQKLLEIIASFSMTVVSDAKATHQEVNTTGEKETSGKEQHPTYYILFKPNQDILSNGTNPLFLIDELHELGSCKALPVICEIPELENIDVLKCYTYWHLFLNTPEPIDAIRDVFIFVEDNCLLEITQLSQSNLLIHHAFLEKIRRIQEGIEVVNTKELKEWASSLEQHVQENIDSAKISDVQKQAISSVKVSSAQLDHLMNIVSELVTTQARLSLFAEKDSRAELLSIAENIEKISRQLRDNAFEISLIPIATMHTRFQRLVRDLSLELGKDIRFLIEGEETKLDKSIIESLMDPLMHILRNCIDHGIEGGEERVKKGKSAQGTILLKAFYVGSYVHIQIQDDGAGMDPLKIKQKAVEQGLLNKESTFEDKDIINLVFLPGFSTAQKVTDVSGRGVGMDVVKRKISDIRGEIMLDSQLDKGTTITLKLPLTLSITNGLLVKIQDTHFVIPLAAVEKCYETTHDKIENNFNDLLVLDGEQIPFINLRKAFNIMGSLPSLEQVVVIKSEERRVGFTVDTIIGEYQAVLKPLGKYYRDHEIISGATILGDGTIALVMDTNKIIKQFSYQIIKHELYE